jgi:hypothetical protein
MVRVDERIFLLLASPIRTTDARLLPVGHVASRTASFSRPSEAVYDAVRDVTQAPTWRSDVTRIEMLDSAGGTVRFRELSRHGPS